MEGLVQLLWGAGLFWVSAMLAASLMEARLVGPLQAMSLVLVSAGKALNSEDYLVQERAAAKEIALCWAFFVSAASWFLEPQYRIFLAGAWYVLFLYVALQVVLNRQIFWLGFIASTTLLSLGAILPFYWWGAPETWKYVPFVWYVTAGVWFFEAQLRDLWWEVQLWFEEWRYDG